MALQVVAVALLLIPFLAFLLLRLRKQGRTQSARIVTPPIDPSSNVASSSGTSSGTARMRRRLLAQSPSTAQEEVQGEEASYYVAKASKKKELKKQEKEARRQAAAAAETRREKQDRNAELRRRKDEEREAEEERKAEEMRIQREKEDEEADKWKGSITVETEGTAGEDTEEGQNLIQQFVNYLEKHKVVAFEDLAAEFRLPTQECIKRIKILEEAGRISGVMDDRGKFIFISLDEMKAVADYIKREGRASIANLARKSNEFIDLEVNHEIMV